MPADDMTLRDWFAGQALAGMLNAYVTAPDGAIEPPNDDPECTFAEVVAHDAYKYADAMLAEKRRHEQATEMDRG